MLDYLASKMVWIVAAIVLTASVIGVFNWQRSSMEELELDERADGMQEIINELFGVSGEFSGTISLREDPNATYSFPSTINDEAYSLNLTSSGFFINQNSKRLWRPLIGEIDLFDPIFLDEDTTISTMDNISCRFGPISIKSGDRVCFEARHINSGTYLFFFKPDLEGGNRTSRVYDETRRLGGCICEMGKLDGFIFNETREMTLKTTMVFSTKYLHHISEGNDTCRTPYTHHEIQLWHPEDRNYTFNEIDRLNDEVEQITIKKGQNVTVYDRVVSVIEKKDQDDQKNKSDREGNDDIEYNRYDVLLTFLQRSN